MPSVFRVKRLPYLSLAGLAIIILAMIGAIQLNRSQKLANQWVMHTLNVELHLNRVMVEATRIEAANRGFLLFHDRRNREGLDKAIGRAALAADQVVKLTFDNAEQRAKAERLRDMVAAKTLYARGNVILAESGQQEAAIKQLGLGEGRRLIRRILRLAEAMIREESSLLEVRANNAQRLIGMLSFGLALVIGLLVLVAIAIVIDARRRFNALTQARVEAETAEAAARSEMQARESAETRMRQMQKMESIGQLTGGIAHDFNNMLAIIIGSLDLVERRIRSDPDRAIQNIESAREGAERAATLTARLLAFARQQPLAPVPMDVNRLVSGMSELLRRTLGETISVETVLSGGLWPSFTDPSQLENAILNLAVNARDAMHEGGRLTIETANAYLDDNYAANRDDVTPGQYVMIGISDTGEGMSPETISRAFDPFFTTKEVGKGTGLGLSQVFGFVKQSGGHIAIYSEVGEGTTLKLYLPRHRGAVTDALPRPKTNNPLATGKAAEVILVVEDEQRVRHFSVDALRELGYTVLSAGNGADALKLLEISDKVTLLFTDVVMPEMNGRKLADAAREANPDLKILYTTGYTRNAVVHNGMLDAGVAFLAKPFTMEQLATKVRAVLDGQGDNRPG